MTHERQDFNCPLLHPLWFSLGSAVLRGSVVKKSYAALLASLSAKTDRLSIVSVGLRSGKHHCCNAVAGAVERSQHLESIEVRHEQIKHEDVGMVSLHHIQGLLTVGRRAFDLKIFLRRQ